MIKVSDIILKGRFFIIFLLIVITSIMYHLTRDVKMSYEHAQILPRDSQIQIDFNDFKSEFGESINTMVIAVQDVRVLY